MGYMVNMIGRPRIAHYMLYRMPNVSRPEGCEYKALVVKQCPEEPGQPFQSWKLGETTLSHWYTHIYQTRVGGADLHTETIEKRMIKIIKDIPKDVQDQIECERLCKELSRGEPIT
jgi:hypothetical protein